MRGRPLGPDSIAELTPNVPGDLGEYRLLTRIARGGMADVYLAERIRHTGTGYLAVKVLLPRLAQRRKFVDMFMAEGRLGLMLTHPNIVKTIDVGSVGRVRFLAMEFIEGQDLGRIVRFFRSANAPVPVEIALFVVGETLKALEHTHAVVDDNGQPLQLVNRDVSPANIMVGFDGSVRLIDFGIAQALLDYRSQIGSIKGKVTYMSPEQVRGLALDARSDLFSLGTVLYQLLTMQEPFQGPSEFEQMERVREANPPPVCDANRRIDRALSDLVTKAMEKDPADRFQSAEAMRIALETYCQSAAVSLDKSHVGDFVRTEFSNARRALLQDIETARSVLADGEPELQELLPTEPIDRPDIQVAVEKAVEIVKRKEVISAVGNNPRWVLPSLFGLIAIAVILVIIIIFRN